MHYNTRRKSISLQALGIQVPQVSRAHRPSISKLDSQQTHPAKRLKRAHTSSSPTLDSPIEYPPSAVSTTSKTVTFADRPKSSGRNAYEDTPPPSPGASGDSRIDMDSVHDDIVAGVIEQLEKTGNRPHLIKELASVLSTTNSDVNRSANPAALLSSRLATYMRRDWTDEAPCPVAKELIPIHPRKVFYYLTTVPRQELPSSALEMPPSILGGRGKDGHKRIISPSLSNASQDDEASNFEDRNRTAMSPSPEVDLSLDLDDVVYSATADSAPDFPTPPTPAPTSYVASRSSTLRDSIDSDRDLGLNRRAQSPALEGDEQEFTATARDMRRRGFSTDHTAINSDDTITVKVEKTVDSIESDDTKANHSEDAATLSLAHHVSTQAQSKQEAMLLSSPFVKAVAAPMHHSLRPNSSRVKDMDVDMTLEPDLLGDSIYGLTWDIRRPQSVGLDELDDLFDRY